MLQQTLIILDQINNWEKKYHLYIKTSNVIIRGEYRLAKPYRDILRYGDSVLRYVSNMYWIASKGIEMDF